MRRLEHTCAQSPAVGRATLRGVRIESWCTPGFQAFSTAVTELELETSLETKSSAASAGLAPRGSGMPSAVKWSESPETGPR